MAGRAEKSAADAADREYAASQPGKTPPEGVRPHGPTSPESIVWLQRHGGNRAVGQYLARQPKLKPPPKVATAAEVAGAPDPINENALPGWWWWGVGPIVPAVGDESMMRQALVTKGGVDPKVLAASKATVVKPRGDLPYYSFRHPARGVVVRAMYAAPYGLASTSDGSGSTDIHAFRLFVFRVTQDGSDVTSDALPHVTDAERQLRGVTPEIIDALGGKSRFDKLKNADPARLLRLAEKVSSLSADELRLLTQLMKFATDDLAATEASVDAFIAFIDRFGLEKAKEAAAKDADRDKQDAKGTQERTLDDKLHDAWKDFDPKTFGTMTRGQKAAKARQIANKQVWTRLKHMASHPGETAVGAVRGFTDVDAFSKDVWADVTEAASGDKSAYARFAAGAGATGKMSMWLSILTGLVTLALILTGQGAALYAMWALRFAAASLVLALVEGELRIQAAAEATTADEYVVETEKSAAAQTNYWMAVGGMVVSLGFKLVAKTPIGGRLKTVGGAVTAARRALVNTTRTGLDALRQEVLGKLRAARQGLPQLLGDGGIKEMQQAAVKLRAISGVELIDRLAKGDAELQEITGVQPEDAKRIQAVAKTPAGAAAPESLKRHVLGALDQAPAEASRLIGQSASDLDRVIANVEAAKDAAALDKALEAAEAKFSPDAQAAAVDAETARLAEELEEKATASAPAADTSAPGAPAPGSVKDPPAPAPKNEPAPAPTKAKPAKAKPAKAKAKPTGANDPSGGTKTPSATDEPDPAPAADPQARAKELLQVKIDTARGLVNQLYAEIAELERQGKQPQMKAQRDQLAQQRATLANQAKLQLAELEGLNAAYNALEVTPYERARAYSYSAAAAREVFQRAQVVNTALNEVELVDEYSGKPIEDPSIDHLVSVQAIVEMEGYEKLRPNEWKEILSRRDNLRLMEEVNNSSKGSQRWADWETGRRIYGEKVWKEMVALEKEVRAKIQAEIKKITAGR